MGVTVDNTLPYFNELIQQVILPAEIAYLSSINDRNAMDLKECIILLNKVLDYGSENICNMKSTVIMVAHRLSTVVDFDRIIMLENGVIAEKGTYQELIEKNGKFAELVRKQVQ